MKKLTPGTGYHERKAAQNRLAKERSTLFFFFSSSKKEIVRSEEMTVQQFRLCLRVSSARLHV